MGRRGIAPGTTQRKTCILITGEQGSWLIDTIDGEAAKLPVQVRVRTMRLRPLWSYGYGGGETKSAAASSTR
jgi:hypothetical protein